MLTYKYQDQEKFPPQEFSVHTIGGTAPLPKGFAKQQLALLGRSIRNWQNNGFRGTADEAQWWHDQFKHSAPDVAIAQYGSLAIEILPIFRQYQVPLVVHFHGYDLARADCRPLYRWRLLKSIKHFAACVVVAKYQYDWLVEHGVDGKMITIIPCGAPIKDRQQSQGVGNPDCRFLAVGRFVEKKRPDLSLRAFAAIADQIPGSRFTFIGDGPYEAKCKQMAKEHGIEDRVDFMGRQPPEQVEACMAQASVFVQHSVTAKGGDKEGWPVSIAEAAGSGLPVISTTHASIPEQVEQGVTGLLGAEGDWQAMSQHMLQLAKDPELRIKMGHAARNKMLQYDTPHQVAQLEQLLIDVANRATESRG